MGARQCRFHLDQGGHSITVVWESRSRRAELLVDGKVLALARTAPHATTELRGEIADPTGAPRPFTVRLADLPDAEPLCAAVIEGRQYLMPLTPLTGREQWQNEPAPPPRTPAELLARWRHRRRHRHRRHHGRYRHG
ncbi:hypothetical protein ABZ135_13295 [Streptomyces sp. NPDC006339]|uniref:hypothetical protein n=1 Tax=Streptomyces sp. NPDC006339 TaxID=3156755 RepID=UPI0033AC4FF2